MKAQQNRVLRVLSVWLVLAACAGGCARGGEESDLGSTETDANRNSMPRPETPSERGRRMALVIGNAAYAGGMRLANPVRDARAMAAGLTEVGFSVTIVEDATRQQMAAAIAGFASELDEDDAALFYYAGHGMQLNRENYLIPTDYAGQTEEAVRFQAISAATVQVALRAARVTMLVFDACRNNPYRGTRGGAGLAPMEARGTLIAYAAGAGQEASDNPGEGNGLFTSKLLEALREPGLTATALFQQVRREVYAASDEQQWPAVYNDLLSDFVFRAAASMRVDANTLPSEALVEQENIFWQSVADSENPAGFQAYLEQFPTGVYAPLARVRMAALVNAADDLRAQDPQRAGVAEPPVAQRPAFALEELEEAALGLDFATRQRVQWGLQGEGYSPGAVDGMFGAGTRTAIRRWQEAQGMTATGYLDAADVQILRLPVEEATRQAELAEQASREAEARRQAELAEQASREAEARRQAELAEQASREAEARRQAELAEQASREAEARRQAELAEQASREAEARRQAELAEQAALEAAVPKLFMFEFEPDDVRELTRACPGLRIRITRVLSEANALVFDHKGGHWEVRSPGGAWLGSVTGNGGDRTSFVCEVIEEFRNRLVRSTASEVSAPVNGARPVVFLGLGGGHSQNTHDGFSRDERDMFATDCPRVQVTEDPRSANFIVLNIYSSEPVIRWGLHSYLAFLYSPNGDRLHGWQTSRRGTLFRELCEFLGD